MPLPGRSVRPFFVLRYSFHLYLIEPSAVLEFATLSRLTGDDRFEKAAKRAFYALWNRRSKVDLLGIAVDSSTGVRRLLRLLSTTLIRLFATLQLWIPPHVSHVGAGVSPPLVSSAVVSALTD